METLKGIRVERWTQIGVLLPLYSKGTYRKLWVHLNLYSNGPPSTTSDHLSAARRRDPRQPSTILNFITNLCVICRYLLGEAPSLYPGVKDYVGKHVESGDALLTFILKGPHPSIIPQGRLPSLWTRKIQKSLQMSVIQQNSSPQQPSLGTSMGGQQSSHTVFRVNPTTSPWIFTWPTINWDLQGAYKWKAEQVTSIHRETDSVGSCMSRTHSSR